MYYCPHCGTKVHKDEQYCMKCGKTIPDIKARLGPKRFNKWWIFPIVSAVLMISLIGIYTYYFNHQSAKAMELYTKAESLLLEEKYEEANRLLQESLGHREDFAQADVALQYSTDAMEVEKILGKAKQQLNGAEYNSSLELLQEAEERLTIYHGPLVNILVERIDEFRSNVRLQNLQDKVANSPSMDEIRMLIWEADEIQHPEALEIGVQLRNQLVDFTFSKASEALNDKQFNDALLIAEDGLKYVPDSEKLHSLLANINKEKLSFESAEKERLEQAIDTAYKESQINETAAIEMISADLENDSEGHIVVKGEVKSIATVPINSVLVEYTLSRNGDEFLTNEIYVYPDALYPGEHGKFEFTHFDLKDKSSEIDAEVKRITWYTE